jgi:hypothetical protein
MSSSTVSKTDANRVDRKEEQRESRWRVLTTRSFLISRVFYVVGFALLLTLNRKLGGNSSPWLTAVLLIMFAAIVVKFIRDFRNRDR